MNEAGFWTRHVRPALNRPPRWVAWKLDPGSRKGFPDVLARLDGQAFLLELKYLREPPKRASTTIRPGWRPGQRAHLVRWNEAGPVATGFLLIGIGEDFLVLPPLKEGTLAELQAEAIVSGRISSMGDVLASRLIDLVHP